MLFIPTMKCIFFTNLPSQLSTPSSSQTFFPIKSISSLQTPKFLPLIRKPFSVSSSNSVMESPKLSSGEVHVIIGPMFAGKTTALLRRMLSEKETGRNVAVVKSSKDTRYGLDSIVTHDGKKLPCWAMPDLSSFRAKLGDDAYEKLDVIGIDEAQFFDDLYDFCCKAADHDGKTVVVAGLDGDYLRRRFGSVLDIVPLADTVTKLTARCELCGKRAFFTLRKTDDTQTELVAGSDVYKPVCRQHYVDSPVAIEVARVILDSQKVQSDPHVEPIPLPLAC
ncbi:hypothetical protein MKX01_013990 [Papaver californicum]|nr:hypothetical protein MKX01_013990 [Papaver californicum]